MLSVVLVYLDSVGDAQQVVHAEHIHDALSVVAYHCRVETPRQQLALLARRESFDGVGDALHVVVGTHRGGGCGRQPLLRVGVYAIASSASTNGGNG